MLNGYRGYQTDGDSSWSMPRPVSTSVYHALVDSIELNYDTYGTALASGGNEDTLDETTDTYDVTFCRGLTFIPSYWQGHARRASYSALYVLI
jgi:hypothetical protein